MEAARNWRYPFAGLIGALKLDRFLRGEGNERGPVLLGFRRIYILPTGTGVWFAFVVAAVLVISGYKLQEWALESGSQIWINLSPDVMGAGLLVFVAGIVLWLMGKMKKVKW